MADITWAIGDKLEFESGLTRLCQCAQIDTDKYVVVYMDVGDANAGKARVATVSGTTITWGAISEFEADVSFSGQPGVCKLDTDKFVVVYASGTNGDDGYARVGTVSTRTISWGTIDEFETGSTQFLSCCQLATDKFAIIYNDRGNSDLGTACIVTVSGDTLSPGSPVAFEDSFTGYGTSCTKLDTDKFVAVYLDLGDSYKIKACAFTVSGTVPTPGTIKDIDTNTCSWPDCAQLDTDKFVATWQDDTSSAGEMRICTVSGTTITTEAVAEFTSNNTYMANVAKIDTTHFVVVFRDFGNSSKGTSSFCSVSGTTITPGSKEIFNDAAILDPDVCLISGGKLVAVYQDDADVNDIGEAVIGEFSVGWSGGDVNGVAIATISKINGVAIADITKVNGV